MQTSKRFLSGHLRSSPEAAEPKVARNQWTASNAPKAWQVPGETVREWRRRFEQAFALSVVDKVPIKGEAAKRMQSFKSREFGLNDMVGKLDPCHHPPIGSVHHGRFGTTPANRASVHAVRNEKAALRQQLDSIMGV